MESPEKVEATAEETIADEGSEPLIVSVTDLSSYLYCPRALYRQKVLGYEEKLSEAMIMGAIRHNFYDVANKYEERIIVRLPAEALKEEIVAAYTETYQNLLRVAVKNYSKPLVMLDLEPEQLLTELQPIAQAEAAERAINVYSFATRNNVFGNELWRLLTPKILTELRAKSSVLRLKGVVDRVEVYNDLVVPIELKTGRMAKDGIWPAHRVQVAAYMMLLQEKFNTPVNKAIIRYLDFGSSKTVTFNPYMELEVKELTEKVIRLLQSEMPPKQCGRESCNCAR